MDIKKFIRINNDNKAMSKNLIEIANRKFFIKDDALLFIKAIECNLQKLKDIINDKDTY